jgi:hypothetical protein
MLNPVTPPRKPDLRDTFREAVSNFFENHAKGIKDI